MSSGPGALTGPRAADLEAVLTVLNEVPAADLGGLVKLLWETQLEPAAVADDTPPDVVSFLGERMLANCALGLRTMGQILLSSPDRTKALRHAAAGPLLVLYGEKDDAWAPSIQEAMAERLGAQRVCIPGAVHSPAVEAPETTASTLTKFWNLAESRR
jgi:pimeloyl-ACP methyl ester carboxylesterase